jgi:hypothetical protein
MARPPRPSRRRHRSVDRLVRRDAARRRRRFVGETSGTTPRGCRHARRAAGSNDGCRGVADHRQGGGARRHSPCGARRQHHCAVRDVVGASQASTSPGCRRGWSGRCRLGRCHRIPGRSPVVPARCGRRDRGVPEWSGGPHATGTRRRAVARPSRSWDRRRPAVRGRRSVVRQCRRSAARHGVTMQPSRWPAARRQGRRRMPAVPVARCPIRSPHRCGPSWPGLGSTAGVRRRRQRRLPVDPPHRARRSLRANVTTA